MICALLTGAAVAVQSANCVLAVQLARKHRHRRTTAIILVIANLLLALAGLYKLAAHPGPAQHMISEIMILLTSLLLTGVVLWTETALQEIRSSDHSAHHHRAQFLELFEHMKSGALICRPLAGGQDFEVSAINQAGEKIDRLSRDTICGKKVSELWPAAESFGLLPMLRQVWQTGTPVHCPPARYDDGRISGWRDYYIYRLDSSGELVAIYTDSSLSRQMGEERGLLSAAVENAHEAIIITSPEGIIQYVNRSFEKMYGYSRAEAEGQSISLLRSGHHSDGFYREMWQAIQRQRGWEGRVINRCKNGNVLENEVTIAAILSPAGEVTHYVSVQRDISHESELESQLIQAQKMQAIGTLASGIAHDFNNILFALIGYAELSLRSVDPDSDIGGNLKQVIRAGERATELVRQILTFSRQTTHERKPLFIQMVIKEALKLLRRSLPPVIEIREEIDNECEMVLADPTRIHQVIMNLCTNGYHAMQPQGGGTLTVRLREIYLSPERARAFPTLKPGHHVELTVSDTGHGMDESVRARIFEPYFSTKHTGEGTGLGLAVVHGIIEAHEGAVSVKSAPNKGSTFQILLPSHRKILPELEEEKSAELYHGQGHILFVDDENAVASVGKKILEHLGYKVTALTDSTEALELFKNCPEVFDLILTDQMMPGLTGTEMVRKMMQVRNDLPVVLISGYMSEPATEEKCRELGIRCCLSKPIDIYKLSAALSQVFSTHPTPSAHEKNPDH